MNLRDLFMAGAFARGGGGAVSPEQITEAVNSYLDKNPVESYTLPVANATTLGGVKPVTATSDMTQTVGVDANGKLFTKPGEGGVDLAMTGADVGQIAKITAVDASGVPTAWEPVAMPSGGGSEEWEHICDISVVEDTENPVNAIVQDLGAEYRKLQIIIQKNDAGGIVTSAGSMEGVTIHADNEWNPGKVAVFSNAATSSGYSNYISDIEYNKASNLIISTSSIGSGNYWRNINVNNKAPMKKLWFKGTGFKTFTINIYGVRA